MSGIGFNVNVNTNNGLVEVFNEAPTTGTAATGAADAKPTLTQVQSEALGSILQTFMETAVKLSPPGANTQANAAAMAQTALEGLKELAPGFGITAEAIKELSVTVKFAGVVANQASQPGADPQTTAKMAGQLETQAGNLAAALRDIVTNSSYPNFTDMLKELMALAQEVKEAASKVKLGAIEGKYDLQMAGAKELRAAAKDEYDAAVKEIKAERTAAWVSFGFAVVAGGAAVAGGSGLLSEIGSMSANALANSLNTVGSSVGTLATTDDKLDAAALKKTAAEHRASSEELNAGATKEDANIQIASEIEEAAKKLRDAGMQSLGTLISNLAQVLRTAAEV